MTIETAEKVVGLLTEGNPNGNAIFGGAYGGEPFINLNKFTELLGVLKPLMVQNETMFISSNGSFLTSESKTEKIINALSAFGVGFTVRISNTAYHQRHWRWSSSPCKTPGWLYLSECYDKNLEMYIEKYFPDRDYQMNPSGRALENQVYAENHRGCGMLYALIDNIADKDLTVYADGRIGVCCYCESGTIGNVHEIESIEDVRGRLEAFLAEFHQKLIESEVWRDDFKKMDFAETCEICRSINLNRKGTKNAQRRY